MQYLSYENDFDLQGNKIVGRACFCTKPIGRKANNTIADLYLPNNQQHF